MLDTLETLENIIDTLQGAVITVPWTEKHQIIDLKNRALFLRATYTSIDEHREEIEDTVEEFIALINNEVFPALKTI